MKKVLFLMSVTIIFLLLGGLIILRTNLKNVSFKIPSEKDSENAFPSKSPQISTSPGGYKSVWITVRDTDKLYLFSNLEGMLSSKDLATKNSCIHLVSGGFYDTKGNHIGLLISDGQTISESQDNKLFNGYFSISKTGSASLTEYPVFSPRISLQSGPFLFKNSSKVTLNLENDENARRVALGIDKNQSIYFFAIYDQTNSFSGPKLSDLPEIFEKINSESRLNLINVINLDGGAHSAFLTDIVNLSEASPIGSYFCIKP